MYQALYRKWRPKTFDEVVGQEHITDTLKNQIITGRLSHAYLFIGTRGTGKTTCAKILAKALNCQSPVNGNPCGRCPACLGIEDGSILDVVEIDAASNNGVDNVRQLRDDAVFAPVSVKKRVYIIDEVHMLSIAAFNALLKILEGPPEHLAFILATTELNKVPATILSRCQRHSFKRLDSKKIADHIEYVARCEGLRLHSDAARLIAGLAEGGMRDALSLLDQCSGSENIDVDAVYSAMGLAGNRRTAVLLDHTVKGNTEAALTLFDELWKDGKDPATLLSELNTLLRDCMMLSVAPHSDAGLLSGRFDRDTLSVFCKRMTKAELLCRINTVTDYLAKIKNAKSPRLSAELCLISLCDPSLTDGMDEIRARLSRLEYDIRNMPAVYRDADDEDEDDIPPIPDAVKPPEVGYRYDAEDSDIDPSEFAEYQPEDDLLDKKSSLALNPDAPPEADDTLSSEQIWTAVLDRVDGPELVGLMPILSDPTQVRCTIENDTMKLMAVPGFFYNMINDQNVLMRLRAAASDVCGRSLKIQMSELTDSFNAPARDINELRKFKETRFV